MVCSSDGCRPRQEGPPPPQTFHKKNFICDKKYILSSVPTNINIHIKVRKKCNVIFTILLNKKLYKASLEAMEKKKKLLTFLGSFKIN